MDVVIALITGGLTCGALGYFYAVHTVVPEHKSVTTVKETLDSDTVGLL